MQRIKDLKKYGLNTKNRTYIIAEIGINHGGDIKKAKALIDSAAKTGVDAVKFQTYITEKRISKDSQIFNILKECELNFAAFKELKDYTREYSLDFFSTPFDSESVEYLNSIGCNIYKIASFDIVNHKLLNDVSKTKKAVIMSVGMANMNEVEQALIILKRGSDKIALLHCVSAYPLSEKNADLSTIYTLQDKFTDCAIGYSDHTDDIIMPLYAIAAGAQVVEKHFKINQDMKCVDGVISITEAQAKKLVAETRWLEKCFGNGQMGIRGAEKDTAVFRRFSEAE
ncbi:N-acetylneuraminate synthase family protein [Thermoproteota archaeon]